MRISSSLAAAFLLTFCTLSFAVVHNFQYERLQDVVSQLKLDAHQQNVANNAIGDLKVEDRAIRKHEQDDDDSGHHGQHKAALRRAVRKIDAILNSDQVSQFHHLLDKANLDYGKA